MQKKIKVGLTAAFTATLLMGSSSLAFAGSNTVSGNASTTYKVDDASMTKAGTGDVNLDYTNGIGLGGNNTLKMWLVKNSNFAKFTDTRYLTGHASYNLGHSVLNGTVFRVSFQAASSPGANPYWQGTIHF